MAAIECQMQDQPSYLRRKNLEVSLLAFQIALMQGVPECMAMDPLLPGTTAAFI